ncbi:MAG: hypothetical protein HGB03_00020 [Candidatus Yonathbacteria bacterium]|nr:hypothetical protein [Candidatus Yonathbacteria bacterium]NTW48066.1 hypothetical protein [Candidatus Yonathbacteria bacterium]
MIRSFLVRAREFDALCGNPHKEYLRPADAFQMRMSVMVPGIVMYAICLFALLFKDL